MIGGQLDLGQRLRGDVHFAGLRVQAVDEHIRAEQVCGSLLRVGKQVKLVPVRRGKLGPRK